MIEQAKPDDEVAMNEALDTLRRQNQSRFRRRIATVGVVLLVAAGVEWHRQVGLWATGTWYGLKAGGKTTDIDGAFDSIEHDGAIVIDVREPVEYDTGHLRAALSLPLSKLKSEGRPHAASRQRSRFCSRPCNR